jgi:hypothetical protein
MIRAIPMLIKRRILLQAIPVMFLLFLQSWAYAQQPPPRPISVSANPALGLRFGAFFQSPTGGTVVVSSSGIRTSTGAVVLTTIGGFAYGPAEFDIVATPGTLINILNGPDVTLYGSAGGSMMLHIGSSSPASPLVTTVSPPSYNAIYIGGTLTVSSPVANPTGSYSGSFSVTFFQE